MELDDNTLRAALSTNTERDEDDDGRSMVLTSMQSGAFAPMYMVMFGNHGPVLEFNRMCVVYVAAKTYHHWETRHATNDPVAEFNPLALFY